MARNKSETEPTIEGASEALMHVLRMDAMGVKTPDDELYEALNLADKQFYTQMDISVINTWAPKFKAWRKANPAQEEDQNATQPK